MFIGVLDHPDFARFDLTSLRTGVMAGSPCPVEVMKRCVSDMHMDEVTICYGMTETSPVSFQSRTDDPIDRRVSTVGRVHPARRVQDRRPRDGAVVPTGDAGRGLHARLLVMLGYWENEEATAGGHRRRRVDAHRRPRDDGRRRLRQHRRAASRT